MSSWLAGELTWIGDHFEAGLAVEVGTDGRIARVGPAGDVDDRVESFERLALVPGFVNAHSHAFQRGLRGAGETFPAGAGSFWTWREAMYGLVEALDPTRFLELTTQAYREMRLAGITTVGEFHYLHHDRPGDFGLDELVLEAATSAGIHLVLLEAYYRTGGIGRDLEGGQRRFRVPSPEAYWRRMDELAARCAASGVELGAVVHSVRAADPGEISEIAAEALRRGLVLHLHLEEQRREIEETVAAYGVTPMRMLLDRVDVGPWVTAVHCTHSDPDELGEYLARGGRVCICPLTEGNLGDGLPPLDAAQADAGQLAFGTDSNLRISALEEMRWLEYGQRLRSQRRGVLRDGAGAVAPGLLRIGTAGGAAALGLSAGAIAPGTRADFAALDLDHPALSGATAETLPDALVFGAPDDAVAGTCVGGAWRWRREDD